MLLHKFLEDKVLQDDQKTIKRCNIWTLEFV